MKKLSIVLALIMALSCFSLTAFAADETTTAAAETTTAAAKKEVKVVIGVNLFDLEGNLLKYDEKGDLVPNTDEVKANTIVLNYVAADGSKLTATDILNAVKSRLGEEEVDLTKYALNETVLAYDDVDLDGIVDDPYKFTETKIDADYKYGEYHFAVYATEIDYEAVLGNTIGEQLAKIDWKGIAGANVTLINQLINASKAAIDSLVNAEWPDADKKDEAKDETTTAATVETPDTGVSAVAGAAVVVLALSATTAVVLRKKED